MKPPGPVVAVFEIHIDRKAVTAMKAAIKLNHAWILEHTVSEKQTRLPKTIDFIQRVLLNSLAANEPVWTK